MAKEEGSPVGDVSGQDLRFEQHSRSICQVYAGSGVGVGGQEGVIRIFGRQYRP